jgi:hypothetical protein
MSNSLIIENRGQEIVNTNYWDSKHARYCYLSWNAGAARLLLPEAGVNLDDMLGAPHVIISRGPWQGHGQRAALEILFDDASDSPYAIHLAMERSDRRLPSSEHGRSFMFTVWTRAGKQLELPGKYRVVAAIPCLDPWNG